MNSERKNVTRREFITRVAKTGTIAASGVFLGAPALGLSGTIQGANDRVNMAVAGINGQGASHFNHFSMIKDVRVKTIC